MNYGKHGLSNLTALILAACVCACGGDYASPRGKVIGVPTVVGTLTAAQLDATAAAAGLQALAGSAKCDVKVVQINYQTPGAQPSEMSNASGAVLIPGGASCPGPFPLVAYARGTNVEKPRTLANLQDPETINLMAFYAAQGYAVVATDYLGYALSAYPYHPYLHADSEASTVIDSIRATRQAAASLGLTLSGKVMVTGYSQGGHASAATQRAIERDNAAEINLVAAAHLAAPYNLSETIVASVKAPAAVGLQAFIPFMVTSLQKVYGNVYGKATDVFNSPFDGYIETLLPNQTLTFTTLLTSGALPADAPAVAIKKVFKSDYLADLVANPNNGTLIAAKKQNLLGWSPKAPTTLCGGSGDPLVGFDINAVTAYNDFKSHGSAMIAIADVDQAIRNAFGGVLTGDSATYLAAYHPVFEPPFCHQIAKALFDKNR